MAKKTFMQRVLDEGQLSFVLENREQQVLYEKEGRN